MRTQRLICLITLFVTGAACAQNKFPVIAASSGTVHIRDAGKLVENAWKIEPSARPDVYLTTAKNTSRVTFYTDRDSISFQVKPGQQYDFLIVLNGKDTAWTQIKCEIPFIEKLTAGKKYNYNDQRSLPAFRYQSPDDTALQRLRRDWKLDSIAGKANEVSKMINLMYWVHQTIPYDGNAAWPQRLNARDIVKTCISENRGVNCRMQAIVLNECYLAMGFKSRYVTCMPKELKFSDCHVINAVYSSELKKWVWMDPSFGAYVMDEKGGLLGLQEVRDRLIRRQPLLVNPDASLNRQMSLTKEWYLDTYMAKNLYRMECIVDNYADAEMWVEGKHLEYIELVPEDALNQKGDRVEKNGRSWFYHRTNNPDLFWAKP